MRTKFWCGNPYEYGYSRWEDNIMGDLMKMGCKCGKWVELP